FDKQSNIQKKDINITYFENEISKVVGTKVRIQNKNNKGKIIIDYYSLDELERIIEKLIKSFEK
ncbi:MAG: chromosome partitioning protein ParB, partial [Candidatus Kapaibacteriota bacterium]